MIEIMTEVPDSLVFESSGDAYNACQCDETMTDGTVFLVPSERIVGVVWTWPVAADPRNAGDLHSFDDEDPDLVDAYPTDDPLSVPLAVRQGYRAARERARSLGWL